MDYILSIDQGTSASKALIFSLTGEIVASASCPLRSYYPKHGYVEQDGDEIVESVVGAVKKALDQFEAQGQYRRSIAAVGISNQRESFLLWDKAGKPRSPVIVWQCKRSIDICARLEQEGAGTRITEVTGLKIDPYFSGTKLLYLLENEAVTSDTVYFGTIDTWLLYKLTGGASFITDSTNASRTLLMDLDICEWSAEMEALFKKSHSLNLPEIRPSSGNFGATDFGGLFPSPIPICGLAGDSHAACFGEGCFSPGMVKATMGTGSSVVMNTGKRARSEHGMVSTLCWSIEGRRDYALEGVIVSCCSTINWLIEKLGIATDPKHFDTLAASVPDSGGVTLIPAFSGLGGPYWQMNRQAELLGITFGTTVAHIARAGLEAYPFQLKDVLAAMEHDRGAGLQSIKADGGLTRSELSMRIIADLLNTEVRIDRRHEASALGAALLAAIGKGLRSFADIEASASAAPHDVYAPALLDTGCQTLYNRAYEYWRDRIYR
jgi:glycerol kinase